MCYCSECCIRSFIVKSFFCALYWFKTTRRDVCFGWGSFLTTSGILNLNFVLSRGENGLLRCWSYGWTVGHYWSCSLGVIIKELNKHKQNQEPYTSEYITYKNVKVVTRAHCKYCFFKSKYPFIVSAIAQCTSTSPYKMVEYHTQTTFLLDIIVGGN